MWPHVNAKEAGKGSLLAERQYVQLKNWNYCIEMERMDLGKYISWVEVQVLNQEPLHILA